METSVTADGQEALWINCRDIPHDKHHAVERETRPRMDSSYEILLHCHRKFSNGLVPDVV